MPSNDPVLLTIELVPRSCWCSNVRDAVSRKEWDGLRKLVYRQAGQVCEVCGGTGARHPVECHEEWAYDDERHVQRLVRMLALCPACHEVKHIGLAGVRNRRDAALQHLARVNGWSRERAENHEALAFRRWRERSTHLWTLDLGALHRYGIDPAGTTTRTPAERQRRAVEVLLSPDRMST